MSGLFLSYSEYIRERYGCKGYRVSVDAGFSCPNRSGDRMSGGCSYCDSAGSRSPYILNETTLKEQISTSLKYLKYKYKAEVFFLYFQAYTNTFAPVDVLRRIYTAGLQEGPFRELIVSTRPDCLDREKIDLLCEFQDRGYDIWLELGLQSAHNETLERINRGHTAEDFFHTVSMIRQVGLKWTVHLIFGLPGEDRKDILDTVKQVAELSPDGIKIHNLHIPERSAMFKEYLLGELSFPGPERHIQYLADALELLPEKTVIMRISTDTPPGRSGCYPGYFPDKNRLYELLNEELKKRGTKQGCRCPHGTI